MAKGAVVLQSEKLRLDSKYFGKAAVRARHFIEQKPIERLGAVTSVLRKGIFDIKADTYTEPGDGVPFLRISDLKNGIINEGSTAWISEAAHRQESATALERGDIAISKTAYPAAALVTLSECNVSQDIIATKLSVRGKSILYEEFVVAFLCSSLGMALMDAEFQGNVQEHFGLVDARKLPIPTLDRDFQERVRDAFQCAIDLRRRSLSRLNDAETRLAASLGLANWSPPEPLSYSISAAAVRTAGRLDAQYFMPAKMEVIEALAALPGSTLGGVFDSIREMVDPSKDASFGLVRNFDVTHALEPVLDDEQELIDFAEVGSTKKRMYRGEVAISRLRAYLKEIAIVDCSADFPVVGSSEFIVLRPKSRDCPIAPATLMTFLRSQPVQTILKWCQDGSQHPRFSETDLLAIPLPDAVATASPTIDALVADALSARQDSRKMIAAAKRAVDIAIEQDEAAALRFLDEVGG